MNFSANSILQLIQLYKYNSIFVVSQKVYLKFWKNYSCDKLRHFIQVLYDSGIVFPSVDLKSPNYKQQQDAADDSHPLDGWNRPMLLIMLPGDRSPGDAIARIISDGPDETPGTVDDLSADVYPDGTMAVLQSASERISPN